MNSNAVLSGSLEKIINTPTKTINSPPAFPEILTNEFCPPGVHYVKPRSQGRRSGQVGTFQLHLPFSGLLRRRFIRCSLRLRRRLWRDRVAGRHGQDSAPANI